MFYNVAPEPRTELNLTPYVLALSALCREQGKSFEGVDDLQRIQEILQQGQKGRMSIEESTRWNQIAERYCQWLLATFPQAHEPACAHPFAKLNHLCERCQARTATVHLTNMSLDRIERHEYCEACYREFENEH